MSALGPVEALAREAAARRLERANVETDGHEPVRAHRRYVELFLRRRDDEAARLQAAGNGDADLAGEVVVAAAAEAKFARLRAQRLAPDRLPRADRGELLECLRDVGARQPIVAMASLGLDRE